MNYTHFIWLNFPAAGQFLDSISRFSSPKNMMQNEEKKVQFICPSNECLKTSKNQILYYKLIIVEKELYLLHSVIPYPSSLLFWIAHPPRYSLVHCPKEISHFATEWPLPSLIIRPPFCDPMKYKQTSSAPQMNDIRLQQFRQLWGQFANCFLHLNYYYKHCLTNWAEKVRKFSLRQL